MDAVPAFLPVIEPVEAFTEMTEESDDSHVPFSEAVPFSHMILASAESPFSMEPGHSILIP